MTFQEQCIKFVFPKLIDSTNNTGNMAKEANVKVDALASEMAQLQAKVKELEEVLAEIRENGGDLLNDIVDRVNMLEARIPEKKTRKPRAKKQADPVAMVEQAAQDAVQNRAVDVDIDKVIVSTPEQAMNEIPF